MQKFNQQNIIDYALCARERSWSTIMSGGESDQKLIEVQYRSNIVKIDVFETVKDA